MNRLLSSALLGSTVVMGTAFGASALPLSATPETDNGIEMVHGYHRHCAGDPDYAHRHSRSGYRIECGRIDRGVRGPNIRLELGDRDRDRRYYRRDRDRYWD